jgi:tetratricopeptide (TPR) repeat protein
MEEKTALVLICLLIGTTLVACGKSRVVEHYKKGAAYVKQGEGDLAIDEYTQAIEIDPQLAEAYVKRGLAYYFRGDIDLAIADYDRAIEIDPQYADAYVNRANA